MLTTSQIFTMFFVTLGPLRVLGPFAQRTRGIDEATVRKIAWWAFVIALSGVVVGSLVGRNLLDKWEVSIPALTLAGGIIFFQVAMRQLLEQYQPAHVVHTDPLPASPVAAACQLLFPIVVSPYGVAAVIALLARSPDIQRTSTILGMVFLVMFLDLLAMLYASRILVGLVIIFLQVLGAVLAVLQVALSVEFILTGLRALGLLA